MVGGHLVMYGATPMAGQCSLKLKEFHSFTAPWPQSTGSRWTLKMFGLR